MAKLLSPVCTDPLKLHNSSSNNNFFCSANRWRTLANTSWTTTTTTRIGGSAKRRRKIKVVAEESSSGDSIADDYYGVLGLSPDATPTQIKKAYYSCMKECHPDLSGDDPETTNFCMFINEVYEILSDPVQRMVYDEIHGYALTAINPFFDDLSPRDHTFVDELSCIGCKNCAHVAPNVFSIEEDFGRARVCGQSGNPDLIQQAIDSCPVDCIHWTSAAQLSLLEDEMRRVERVNVALMLSGMGGSSVDVFRTVLTLMPALDGKSEKARMRMMQQKDSNKPGSYWSDLWGEPKNYKKSDEEVKERANRAAGAARRWREYSRRGADRPPTFKLPGIDNGLNNNNLGSSLVKCSFFKDQHISSAPNTIHDSKDGVKL
ncbi:hypothetical protein GIB67_027020 [Kingdonia uniflora]|uniref:DNAJ heat shock N-terminal domain-containing protein n=1 Tax=Kingdonia uniflora TaxID=39325 RepID=A0A7J7P1L4_9MAGN|nr:hypothetical protein GIB67_027020 [Kingdonia uniflora]